MKLISTYEICIFRQAIKPFPFIHYGRITFDGSIGEEEEAVRRLKYFRELMRPEGLGVSLYANHAASSHNIEVPE